MAKTYIGDGVYVNFDGFHIVLTTEDGITVTNEIFLEPNVLNSFELYVADVRTSIEARGGKL